MITYAAGVAVAVAVAAWLGVAVLATALAREALRRALRPLRVDARR